MSCDPVVPLVLILRMSLRKINSSVNILEIQNIYHINVTKRRSFILIKYGSGLPYSL